MTPSPIVPGSAFRDLAAYRIAAELSDELYRVVRQWPVCSRQTSRAWRSSLAP
jgi:hypothetical protein